MSAGNKNNSTKLLFAAVSSYPRPMTELDAVWSQMLDDAGQQASDAGRHAIAEYLRLKATNDAIRTRGVAWLLDSFIEIAMREHRTQNMTVERDEPHSFARGASNMVGTRLSIRLGVRCLTVEAGWARTPADGIMRKGALAFAQLTHFGMPRESSELRLVHGEDLPKWLGDSDAVIDSSEIRRHIDVFLDR